MSAKAKRKKDAAARVAVTSSSYDDSASMRGTALLTGVPTIGAASFDEGPASRPVFPPDASALQSITERLCEEASATGAAIALDREGQTICVASTGIAPPVGVTIDRGTGISGVCLRTAKTIVCDDAETDPRVNRVSIGDIRSILAVPVRWDARTSGLVELLSTSIRAFTSSHVALAEDVARSIEEQYAQAASRPGSAFPAAVEQPQTHFFGTMEGSTSDLPVSWTFSDRIRKAIALIGEHNRTIAISCAVLAVFLAVLWVALRPRSPQPQAQSQRSETVASPVETAAVPTQQQPPVTDTVAPSRSRVIRSTNTSPNEPKAPADQEPIVLQSAALGDTRRAPSQQVEAPPSIASTSQLSAVPLNTPQTAVALAAPRRSGGELVYQVKPAYPAFALSRNFSGTVQLLATVAPNGRVSKVEVLSGDATLAASAVSAVRQWRYKPLVIDGRAVEQQLPVNVNFKARQD